MRKRRILALASWYPNHQQPFLGNFVQRHVTCMAQRHEVVLIHSSYQTDLHEVKIEKTSYGNLTEIFVQLPTYANPFTKAWKTKRTLNKLFSQLGSFDVVHGHVAMHKGWSFLWAKKYFNCPLWIFEHASYYHPERRKQWSFFERMLLNRLVAHTDLWIVPSTVLRDTLLEAFPAIRQLEVVPNIVEQVFFDTARKESERLVFTHISTLDDQVKNIGDLFRAIALLHKKRPNAFEFRIISDESYAEWERRATLENLTEVRFFGPLSPDKIATQLAETSALVLYSHYETFSIVLAEAWASGVPTITTPVGIATNLPSALGLLVPPRDPEALCSALERYLDAPSRFSPDEIRTYAQSFQASEVAERFDNLFANFLK